MRHVPIRPWVYGCKYEAFPRDISFPQIVLVWKIKKINFPVCKVNSENPFPELMGVVVLHSVCSVLYNEKCTSLQLLIENIFFQ